MYIRLPLTMVTPPICEPPLPPPDMDPLVKVLVTVEPPSPPLLEEKLPDEPPLKP